MANGLAESLAGMSPKQSQAMTQLAVGALQSKRKMDVQEEQFSESMDLQKEQLAQEVKNKRIQNKLNLLNQKITDKFNQRKLAIQEQRADAYDRMTQAQTNQADMQAQKAAREIKMLERQATMLDGLKNTQTETTYGPMSLGTVYMLGDQLPGLKPLDMDWKSLDVVRDENGEETVIKLQPATGDITTEKTGITTMEEEEAPRQWESLSGKMDDAEQTVLRSFGASELSGLDADAQPKFNAANTLAQSYIREDESIEGKEAATKAFKQTKQFESKINRITDSKISDRSKLITKMKPLIKQAMELEARTGSSLYSVNRMTESLMELGLDENEAMDILKAAYSQSNK